MVNPIQLSIIDKEINSNKFMEKFDININKDFLKVNDYSNIFNEAYFINGRETCKPIEEQFQLIKDELNKLISTNDPTTKKIAFDPKVFIKSPLWKELENRIRDVFGLRNVEMQHMNETYIKSEDTFKTRIFNCFTYTSWRYPIDGLITDKGFYDNTHSINCSIIYSLKMIKELNADELVAIFLHELGHNIDPALVDISYHDVNELSKYITENRGNKELDVDAPKKKKGFIEIMFPIIGIGIWALFVFLLHNIANLLFNPTKAFDHLRTRIRRDKEKFDRKHNQEAFADNLPRMYGYGVPLMSALGRIDTENINRINNWNKRERSRQRIYAEMIEYSIKDVHKTDIHRAYALIKEYELDLKDPNIPDKVKKNIKEDLEELKKYLNVFVNQHSEFINKINKMMLEELNNMDDDTVDKKTIQDILTDKPSMKESTELVTEKKNTEINITKDDYDEIKKHFGNKKHQCSFHKDQDGYYCKTHRARSKSYPSISDIPKKDYEFISSTS